MTLLRYLFHDITYYFQFFIVFVFPFVQLQLLNHYRPDLVLSFHDGRNPLWLLVLFVGYLLTKALWVQLDISGEFRNGAVSVEVFKHWFPHKSVL